MERCNCSDCNKTFLYDSKQVPYRAYDDFVCKVTLYKKIITCPYCGTAYALAKDSYYREWD